MGEKTLFVGWQQPPHGRWFPIGRLDADVERSEYCFQYINGVKRAQRDGGFRYILEFRDLKRQYRSSELFPLFQNRVMSATRPDFGDYLLSLGLEKPVDPVEILSVNGGYRTTDSFEVFPKLSKNPEDGHFLCRFLLHGRRYVTEAARGRIEELNPGENLVLALELNNPATGVGIQLQTDDHHLIGWSPAYLVDDLHRAMTECPGECRTHVVRFNPAPTPSQQRVLIEMSGRWKEHIPMSGDDFTPLVNR